MGYDPKSVEVFIDEPIEFNAMNYQLIERVPASAFVRVVHAPSYEVNVEMTVTDEGARALWALVTPRQQPPRGSASIPTLIRRALFNSRKGRSAHRRLRALGAVVRNWEDR